VPERENNLLRGRPCVGAQAVELTNRESVPQPDWVPFSDWVDHYHSKCSELIWKKLLEHEKEKDQVKTQACRCEPPVAFNCSSLYVERAEAVRGVKLCPERNEDISHYVSVVGPERRKPERSGKRGLVEVVTVEMPNGFGLRQDDEAEDDIAEVVPGGVRCREL
jgi:hypothetical protein